MASFGLGLSEDHDGKCTTCGQEPLLIVPLHTWEVPYHDEQPDGTPEEVEIAEEVSAHYCQTCQKIISLSFNQYGEEVVTSGDIGQEYAAEESQPESAV